MPPKAGPNAVEWIAANTDPEERIFVWGFEPAIYFTASRHAASRYIYDVPLRAAWSRLETRPILMQELAASPPRLIVVQSGDVLPRVTGNLQDIRQSLATFPDLLALLRFPPVVSSRPEERGKIPPGEPQQVEGGI